MLFSQSPNYGNKISVYFKTQHTLSSRYYKSRLNSVSFGRSAELSRCSQPRHALARLGSKKAHSQAMGNKCSINIVTLSHAPSFLFIETHNAANEASIPV